MVVLSICSRVNVTFIINLSFRNVILVIKNLFRKHNYVAFWVEETRTFSPSCHIAESGSRVL